MKNPWEEIKLSDYENHMKLSTVMQLQCLSDIMKKQFYQYPVKTIMIFGIAGGNGLEHMNPKCFEKVYGVDINPQYLATCTTRYKNLEGVLNGLCVDLTDELSVLPYADLIIANLFIEYVGYECFQKAVNKVNPRYVSTIIQVNTDHSFVSDSPYLHAFDGLNRIHHQMEEEVLSEAMRNIQYHLIEKEEYPLPNGKKLVRLNYKR